MKTEKQSAFLRWLPFIPAILAILVFGNSLLNQYAFDDDSVIQTHKFVQEGFEGLDDIFTTPYRWGNFHYNDGLYRPFSTSMFAIEIGLFGNNPLVHHLINVLLYALCGIFLTLLLLRWMGEERQVLV
ncbi:MAG: hypothetical protein QF645_06025, partial [Planctomycetota bacterium]|nr:hypothetical protein [Planctomycetota bacterium]